jgi:hypothetical protein
VDLLAGGGWRDPVQLSTTAKAFGLNYIAEKA